MRIRIEERTDVIDLNGISKTYRLPTGEAVDALNDVSMQIEDGEFVAIMGSSGSGKSTLMNILGLLDVPTAGSYRLSGQETSGLSSVELAQWRNKRIGFVFQTFHLLPRTSALENAELPLLYSDRDSFRGLGRRALEMVELSDRISHRPSELSGGQQQRVAIAGALVNEPDLLLADEPTGNLDRRSADEVLANFQSLNRAGRTIVLVTHDAEVAKHCRRIARIERGRIVADERAAGTAFGEVL
jgi:putative ABC transport system ATP-binding protein